ncbi:hypothetical protein AOLI_G00305280 [Acnodon oligacanthus]
MTNVTLRGNTFFLQRVEGVAERRRSSGQMVVLLIDVHHIGLNVYTLGDAEFPVSDATVVEAAERAEKGFVDTTIWLLGQKVKHDIKDILHSQFSKQGHSSSWTEAEKLPPGKWLAIERKASAEGADQIGYRTDQSPSQWGSANSR